MSEKINIYIGYDYRISVCSQVAAHSILSRSSVPVSFTFLNLRNLYKIYKREHHSLQSTEFSFSRFLVPYLSKYNGWSLFVDNDVIVLEDIAKLWELRDDKYAVMCVKHDHKPKGDVKFMGAVQTQYEKKNWSSVMLFNNINCTKLTPDYVNNATGLELHQFKWLGDDSLIGALPPEWNHLVDYDDPDSRKSLLHYTEGGPYYDDYRSCGFAKEWVEELKAANYSKELTPQKMLEEIK